MDSGTKTLKWKDKKTFSVNLPQEVLTEVDACAGLERRNRTSFIEIALVEYCRVVRHRHARRSAAGAILLLVGMALSLPAMAAEAKPIELVDKKILKREHWYQVFAPREFTYKLDNNEQRVYPKKLKGIKDKRPFAEKHPKVQAFRDGCQWSEPILGVAGTVGVWFVAALAKSRG